MVRKAAIFVDGENLVFRYQDLLRSGRVPRKEVIHLQDVFVWKPGLLPTEVLQVDRLTYYTFVAGEEALVARTIDQIREIYFDHRTSEYNASDPLVARVFRKPTKSHKARMVDISITLDALVATFTHDIDMVILVTGDSDFVPLVQEIARRGKKVHVWSLSSGLSPELVRAADRHRIIDDFLTHEAPASGNK